MREIDKDFIKLVIMYLEKDDNENALRILKNLIK